MYSAKTSSKGVVTDRGYVPHYISARGHSYTVALEGVGLFSLGIPATVGDNYLYAVPGGGSPLQASEISFWEFINNL